MCCTCTLYLLLYIIYTCQNKSCSGNRTPVLFVVVVVWVTVWLKSRTCFGEKKLQLFNSVWPPWLKNTSTHVLFAYGKCVIYMQKVGGFLQVLRFPLPVKLDCHDMTSDFESGVKPQIFPFHYTPPHTTAILMRGGGGGGGSQLLTPKSPVYP